MRKTPTAGPRESRPAEFSAEQHAPDRYQTAPPPAVSWEFFFMLLRAAIRGDAARFAFYEAEDARKARVIDELRRENDRLGAGRAERRAA